jgi:hypothetical protein
MQGRDRLLFGLVDGERYQVRNGGHLYRRFTHTGFSENVCRPAGVPRSFPASAPTGSPSTGREEGYQLLSETRAPAP